MGKQSWRNFIADGIEESDDVGRSLKRDRPQKAKRKVKSGQGERGDR
jgi:hypothetical protein